MDNCNPLLSQWRLSPVNGLQLSQALDKVVDVALNGTRSQMVLIHLSFKLVRSILRVHLLANASQLVIEELEAARLLVLGCDMLECPV